MPANTVRSHYLPQTYLKHFLLDEKLFMYKKGEKFFREGITPEQRIVEIRGESALRNFGLENNLYNPEIPDITSDDFEQLFYEYGERYYTGLLEDIRSIPVGSLIPREIKDKLCPFIASMRVRTPQFKAEVEEMRSVIELHDVRRRFGNMTFEEFSHFCKEELGYEVTDEQLRRIQDAINNANDHHVEIDYPNGFFLQMITLSLDYHADIYHNMTFNIYKSDSDCFITSDNPVTFFVPPERLNVYTSPKSLTSPFVEIFFPLAKDISVHITWRKEKEEVLSANRVLVGIFNYNLSHHSFDFIFSPLKMNDLNKFAHDFVPYPFRFTVR